MTCQKYSSWMIDEVLGGLQSKLETELLAHVAECVECRREFNKVKALRAAIDHGVEAMVAGAPSPQFVTHLRARIAERPGSIFTWVHVTAGVLALTALIAVLIRRTPRYDGAGANNERAPIATVVVNPIQPHLPVPKAPLHTNRLAPSSHARRLEPDVLVLPGQVASLLRFDEALQNHRVNAEQLVATDQELEKPLEVEAIEIPPVDPPKLAESVAIAKDDGKF